MDARQAAALTAVEATGLSKSDIAKIAGIHRSQASRWFSGDQRPSYDRVMRLANYLRREHPGLADELIAATGYGPPGAEPEPPIDPDVLKALKRAYRDDPEKLQEAILAIAEVEGAASGRSEEGPSRSGLRAG